MGTKFHAVFFLLLGALLVATPTYGQTFGQITGLITDTSGGVMVGAEVTVTNPHNGKAVTVTIKLVPANASIRIVKQEAIASRRGKIFGSDARVISGPEPPDKNAFQFCVPERQDSLAAIKGTYQFIEDQPQGFSHASIHFEQP